MVALLASVYLTVPGCTKDPGTGLLSLRVSTDTTYSFPVAHKLVLEGSPGRISRTYTSEMRLAEGKTEFQFPNLPASDSAVNFSVRIFGDNGCVIGQNTEPISLVIKAGMVNGPIDVVIRAATLCMDAGHPSDGLTDHPLDTRHSGGGGGVGGASGGSIGASGGLMTTGGAIATSGVVVAGGQLATGGASVGSGGNGSGGASMDARDASVASVMVTGLLRGAPTGTVVTAISDSQGSNCSGNNCQVAKGGTVTLTAPSVTYHYFSGWTGAAQCTSSELKLVLSDVTSDVECVANYLATYTVTISVVGGPTNLMITPTSTTVGAVCAGSSCRVPVGGTVKATAPSLNDWYFNGWTGDKATMSPEITFVDVIENLVAKANFINQRSAPCLDRPPTNAITTSKTYTGSQTYTTLAGWSGVDLCPWKCQDGYCQSGASCVSQFIDKIAFTQGSAGKWFGGDDSKTGPRNLGVGQGVTPTTTVTMDRFGFNYENAFTYESTQTTPTQPVDLELDVRDAHGMIIGFFTTSVPTTYSGGWIFCDTNTMTLNAGSLYIFSMHLPNAFTQPVQTMVLGDAAAQYSGGLGYSSDVSSGSLRAWSDWYEHSLDFQFRVQQRNSECK